MDNRQIQLSVAERKITCTRYEMLHRDVFRILIFLEAAVKIIFKDILIGKLPVNKAEACAESITHMSVMQDYPVFSRIAVQGGVA